MAIEEVNAESTDAAIGDLPGPDVQPPPDAPRGRPLRWWWIFAAGAVVFCVLAVLPGRTRIPPNIQADYVHMLIAADRLHDGMGYSSLQPVAPNQSWDYQYDYGWLSQWPPAYAWMIVALRRMTACSTVQACQWIGVFVCAAALVGWFAWIKYATRSGMPSMLVAAAGAACGVKTTFMVDPSTDALLLAALPYVLLFAVRAIEFHRRELTYDVDMANPTKDDVDLRNEATLWVVMAGLASGGLFWIRYASVFIPFAIGLCLLIEWRPRRLIRFRAIAMFCLAAFTPMLLLLGFNEAFSVGHSVQEQLNLGQRVGADFTFADLWRAWWHFTDLGYYDYHWFSHYIFAIWPGVLIVFAIVYKPARGKLSEMLRSPSNFMSAMVVFSLLLMLITATSLFRGKFDYVGLDRYYFPLRPMYFVLFVAPLLWIPVRVFRSAVALLLLIPLSWTIQQDWPRPYVRWLSANREATDYGAWAVCFRPGASQLYRWLGEQNADNLIVFSTFHDYISIETGFAALPIPPDQETLSRWVERVAKVRSIESPRILFVLDSDNRWRDYYLPEPEKVIETFNLTRRVNLSAGVSAMVFEYSKPNPS